jgi:membrane protease YdiL (CAAX protease family)
MEEHSQAQHFFTKKRVILISLLFLFVIGLITITIIFVIAPGLDINRLANSFQRAFKSDIELSIILLFLLLLYTFIKTVTNIYPILERVKQAKVKIKFSDYLIFGFFYSFISMISPSSLLTDPYAVF